MKGRKKILSESGFVDKLMELDNYVHWLAATRALKKSKNQLPLDMWTAILDRMLKFAGTPRAKRILGYEKEDQKTGTPICSACQGEYCTRHCRSCADAFDLIAGVPGGRCCHKCRIQVFFSGFDRLGTISKKHHIIGRIAYVGEKP